MGEVLGPNPSMLLTFTRKDHRAGQGGRPISSTGKGAGPHPGTQIPGLLCDLGQGHEPGPQSPHLSNGGVPQGT